MVSITSWNEPLMISNMAVSCHSCLQPDHPESEHHNEFCPMKECTSFLTLSANTCIPSSWFQIVISIPCESDVFLCRTFIFMSLIYWIGLTIILWNSWKHGHIRYITNYSRVCGYIYLMPFIKFLRWRPFKKPTNVCFFNDKATCYVTCMA